jgi:hypothetical protein
MDGPFRYAVASVTPLLAGTALACYALWESNVGPDDLAGVGLAATGAAFVSAAWLLLLSSSRVARGLAFIAVAVAIVAAALWWAAIERLLEST